MPVVIGGDNLPSPVVIGLTDLPNIGGASGPPGPPVLASLILCSENYPKVGFLGELRTPLFAFEIV